MEEKTILLPYSDELFTRLKNYDSNVSEDNLVGSKIEYDYFFRQNFSDEIGTIDEYGRAEEISEYQGCEYLNFDGEELPEWLSDVIFECESKVVDYVKI